MERISFETATKLHNLNYTGEYDNFTYDENGKLDYDYDKGIYKAPLQYDVLDWLREEHGIHIMMDTLYYSNKNKAIEYYGNIFCNDTQEWQQESKSSRSYEDALENALVTAFDYI